MGTMLGGFRSPGRTYLGIPGVTGVSVWKELASAEEIAGAEDIASAVAIASVVINI